MPSVIWFYLFTCCVFVGKKWTTCTFYNINHTKAKQRRYMIGSGRVNCNGAAHAVADHHDGRRGISIEHFHHFADIPLEGQIAKLLKFCFLCIWFLYHKLPTLASAICKSRKCTEQLTLPSCLLRDRLDFSLWSRLPKMKEARFAV